MFIYKKVANSLTRCTCFFTLIYSLQHLLLVFSLASFVLFALNFLCLILALFTIFLASLLFATRPVFSCLRKSMLLIFLIGLGCPTASRPGLPSIHLLSQAPVCPCTRVWQRMVTSGAQAALRTLSAGRNSTKLPASRCRPGSGPTDDVFGPATIGTFLPPREQRTKLVLCGVLRTRFRPSRGDYAIRVVDLCF